MARLVIGRGRIAEVYEFYGRACVICGQPATIHHLDEVNFNRAFNNLIPLCSNANETLQWNRGPLKRTYANAEIAVRRIAASGTAHFLAGNYRQAYACNRLTAYVLETRYNESSAAALDLAYCLSDLLQVGRNDLIESTLHHFRRLSETQSLSLLSKAAFLNQCSLSLFGGGQFDLARDFEEASGEFWKHVRESGDPESFAMRQARILKRKSVILSTHAVDNVRKRKLIAHAETSARIVRELGKGDELSSALYVNALMEYYSGSHVLARKLVEEGLQYSKLCDPATEAELRTLMFLLRDPNREKRRIVNDLESLVILQSSAKSCPIPVMVAGKFRNIDPQALLGLPSGMPQRETFGPTTIRLFRGLLYSLGKTSNA